MRSKILVLSVALLAVALGVGAEGVFMPPIATVRFIDSAVENRTMGVEGVPSRYGIPRQVLLQMPCIHGFILFGGKNLPSRQTEVRLAYDSRNLYIVFSGSEKLEWVSSRMSGARDVPAWRNESVEIFLDPKSDGETYFHLIADVTGATFDAKGQSSDGRTWDGEWATIPFGNGQGWNLAVVIPFESLGVQCPKPGETWAANFGRHSASPNEFSTWSPVGREFNEPWRFGRIEFGNPNSVVASVPPAELRLHGSRRFALRISNNRGTPAKLRVERITEGKSLAIAAKEIPKGEHTWDVSLTVPEGKCRFSLAVIDARDGNIISRSAPLQVDIPPNRTRIAQFRKILRDLSPPAADLKALAQSLEKSLSSLAIRCQAAARNPNDWSALSLELDDIEKQVARLRYAFFDRENRGFVLASENALTKVFRDRLFEGEIGSPVRISMAKNEFESAQLLILAHEQLEDVSVDVTALKGPGSAVIPGDRIKLEIVDYVQTQKPRYEVDYVGWWPDPLLAMKPFDVSPMTIQPIWVTVHTPRDIPAGDYRGELIVKPSNKASASLPIEVHVWDFALPTTMHLKTAFALFPHEIAAWYGGMTDEIKRRYYEFLLDHRLNPTNIYTSKPVPEKDDLAWCIERGLNAFCLAYTHNRGEQGRRELAGMLEEYRAFLTQRGWWDKAYIYGFDEIKPDKYDELRDMYGWLKTQFPDLPRMCTVVPNEELRGFVDIWVPLISNFKPREAQKYLKEGNEIWWYVCCVPPHPFPNFFIDYPAIDPRIIFWMNWKYQVPGFLYYALNNWTTNRAVDNLPGEHRAHPDQAAREKIRAGKRWPEVSWNTFTFDDYNGDGQLIYPGPAGVPFSSIRLECIRDGIEDYEYFYMLRDALSGRGATVDPAVKARAKRALEIADEVVKSTSEYTLVPEVLLGARAEVARLIEKLSCH